MSWAKIDDRANEHRKQLAAGAEACWLWACGLMYANRQPARDGFVPDAMIGLLFPLKNPKRLAEKLCEVALWHKVPGGYQIHEFTLWNQGRQAVEDERAKGRARAAKSYAKRKPKRPEEPPEDSSESSGEEELKSATDSSESSGVRAQTRAGSAAPTPTTSTTHPDGSSSQDPAGQGAVEAPEDDDDQPRRGPEFIPCPSNLELTSDKRSTLETGMIPGYHIDAVTLRYRASYDGGEERRTLEQWLRGLVTAVTTSWSDHRRRTPSPDAVVGADALVARAKRLEAEEQRLLAEEQAS